MTVVEAPIPGLNVRVSGEGEEASYMDVSLVPKSPCVQLLFPPTFTRVNVLLTLSAIS